MVDSIRLLKTVAAVAGALSALAAVFSSTGFLVLRSNANLLGITSFLHHSAGDYIYEGGVFALHTVFFVLPAAFLAHWEGWATAGFLLVYIVLRGRSSSMRRLSRLKDRLLPDHFLRLPAAKLLEISVSMVVVVICIYTIFPSLDAHDLLFAGGRDELVRAEIERRSTDASRQILLGEYEKGVLYVVLTVLFITGIRSFFRAPPPREGQSAKLAGPLVVGNAFSYVLLASAVLLTPIVYGQSVYTNDFHIVTGLVLEEGSTREAIPGATEVYSANEGSIWLISSVSGDYVFYMSGKEQINIVSKSHVSSLTLGVRRNILSALVATVDSSSSIQRSR